MRRCVIIPVGVCGDVLQMCCMGRLASLCQQSEVLEDVILSVSSHPRPVMFVSIAIVTATVEAECEVLPYIIVYRLHHPGLSLPNSHLQTFGLAVAGQRGRSVTYGAVRVHPDDRLSRFVMVVSGIHGLVCEGENGGKDNVFMRSKI